MNEPINITNNLINGLTFPPKSSMSPIIIIDNEGRKTYHLNNKEPSKHLQIFIKRRYKNRIIQLNGEGPLPKGSFRLPIGRKKIRVHFLSPILV